MGRTVRQTSNGTINSTSNSESLPVLITYGNTRTYAHARAHTHKGRGRRRRRRGWRREVGRHGGGGAKPPPLPKALTEIKVYFGIKMLADKALPTF